MLKCDVIEPEDPKYPTTLGDMPPGSVSVNKEGHVYLRTGSAAVCLTAVGKTYSCVGSNTTPIRLLPKGTVVTLTVE